MDNMPDFDKMTPEEINKWLETLAVRQGATEGIISSADMEIAEIDPTSVVIDEPGYVPYGQEGKQQPKAEPAKPPKPEPAPTPVVEKPAPRPEPVKAAPTPAPEPQRPIARPLTPTQPTRQEPPPIQRPAAQIDTPVRPAAPPPPPTPASGDEGGLAWLESLSRGQDDDSLFNLDLGSLPIDEPAPPIPAEPVSSLSWLENLAREDDPFAEAAPARESDPFGGSDSVEWLETLARRQGADTEELITPGDLDIPMPDEAEIEAPGYVAFSFDTPPVTNRAPAPPPLSDPSDFLSSLTEEAPPAEAQDLSLEGIQRAIAAGTVTREQMQVFLEAQADSIVSEPEMDFAAAEDDGELAPADLPAWLLEQVGAPPTAEIAPPPAPTVPIESLFAPVPEVNDDMPAWLKETVDEGDPQLDFGSLFASPEPEPVVAQQSAVEIDPDDTWAEAFDLEHEGGIIDVDTVPDWYERNVKDPARIAAVEQLERRVADEELIETMLPDEDLPVGEMQGVPTWAGEPQAAVAEAAESGFSDWLSELENPAAVEVPDWLDETLIEEPPPALELFDPTPEPPAVVFQPPPTPQPEPPRPVAPPVAVAPRPLTGSAALERARDREQNGDLEGSLTEYEGLIRANIDLDAAVADLTQLVKSYRTVPAVYRVLGDGLMRQGKLQQALNTYREALNQL